MAQTWSLVLPRAPGCPLSTRSSASLLGSGNCPRLARGYKALDLRKVPPTEMPRSERGPSSACAQGPTQCQHPFGCQILVGFLWDQDIGCGRCHLHAVEQEGSLQLSYWKPGVWWAWEPRLYCGTLGPHRPKAESGVWGQEEASSSARDRPIFSLGPCVQTTRVTTGAHPANLA